MSEDPTRALPDEKGKTMQPMIETLVEEVRAMRAEQRDFRAEVERRFEELDVRFDRVEGMTNQTRAVMLTFRADFKEFVSNTKQPA